MGNSKGPCRVAIIGGGAAGVACAVALLRRIESDLCIAIFDPRERLGEGIAYGTRDPEHLLNVRAEDMSVHPDEADSFREWADAGPASYLPRRDYAVYLRDQLAAAENLRGATVEHVRELVVRVDPAGRGYVVHGDSERSWPVDVVILATGNEAPSLPSVIIVDAETESRIDVNPWSRPGVSPGRTLVIGSGLTAIDICLSTLSRDPTASVCLVSRHGLLPAEHEFPWRPSFPAPLFADEDFKNGMTLGQAVRALRATARRHSRNLHT